MEKVENAISVLEEYIAKAEKEDFLRDHDIRFDALRESVKKNSSRLRAPLNVIAPRLYYVADHSFYCIELFKYKYYLLAKGMLNGIKDSNPLSLANNCRCLLEQVATLSYCMNAIEEMLENIKDQGLPEKIDKIISKAELALQRTYAGQGKKSASDIDVEAIHVNTSIKVLDKRLAESISSYDYLCEFVHPNYGNNLLISSGIIGKGKIGSRKNSDEAIIKIAFIGIALLFFNEENTGLFYPTLTLRTHHLVELCFTKRAKITNVFSTKKPIPVGDGKTQKTAFYFNNARTSHEAKDLSYQYLHDNGHRIGPGDRVLGAIDTENEKTYLYDKWTTKDGEIWFKIPAEGDA